MGKKCQKIHSAELRIGDRVRVVGSENEVRGIVTESTWGRLRIGRYWFSRSWGTAYIRTPKKPKPLTRPDEPPVGTFFRVNRTGKDYLRINDDDYTIANADTTESWFGITEPGDTITRLLLVEATDD